MIGAIAGDIIGSHYEHTRNRDYKARLFNEDSCFTDDSVLSIAIAEAIFDGRRENGLFGYRERAVEYFNEDIEGQLCKPGRQIPTGFGTMFASWALGGMTDEPYNSFGNGSAMRVSAVGWAFESLPETLIEAQRSADFSHSHVEGVMGAQFTAGAVMIARTGYGIEEILEFAKDYFGYEPYGPYKQLNKEGNFESSCQRTIPQALTCIREAKDYEDAIRMAISIGGDADTLGAIVGGIAEPLFGVPQDIADKAYAIVEQWSPRMDRVLKNFETQMGNKIIKPRSLLKRATSK